MEKILIVIKHAALKYKRKKKLEKLKILKHYLGSVRQKIAAFHFNTV